MHVCSPLSFSLSWSHCGVLAQKATMCSRAMATVTVLHCDEVWWRPTLRLVWCTETKRNSFQCCTVKTRCGSQVSCALSLIWRRLISGGAAQKPHSYTENVLSVHWSPVETNKEIQEDSPVVLTTTQCAVCYCGPVPPTYNPAHLLLVLFWLDRDHAPSSPTTSSTCLSLINVGGRLGSMKSVCSVQLEELSLSLVL